MEVDAPGECEEGLGVGGGRGEEFSDLVRGETLSSYPSGGSVHDFGEGRLIDSEVGRFEGVEFAGIDEGELVGLVQLEPEVKRAAGVFDLDVGIVGVFGWSGQAGFAATVVNALNPPSYTSWRRDWPPLAASVLAAAERSGARLVTIGNLYGYGQVDAPMTEATPVAPNGPKGQIRAQMWADALAAHRAGRVRATEVRASDYVGPATLASSLLSTYLIAPLLAGKSPRMPLGHSDVRHSWTFDQDVATLVRELALTVDETAYGRVWHVPTDEPATYAEVATLVSEVAGVEPRQVRVLPRSVVGIGGLVVPLLRELKETRHQFERPWVLDGRAAQERFGIRPTPLRGAVIATVEAVRGQATVRG